jgi:hypothetical protein
VRLGAIYALDRIARDSERDHWPIMEVLCAYVRNPQNCGEPTPRPDDAEPLSDKFQSWFNAIRKPRVDIQAALSVIGQRPKERVAFETERELKLDLSGANLQRAQVTGMFARADLSETHLEGASLDAAHLERASLEGAHLEMALLDAAHLEGATLDGAHLEGATLAAAHLEDASLLTAHLEGAILFDADLSKTSGLRPDDLARTLGDATTTLPEGMQRPTNWPDGKLTQTEQREWFRKARAARAQQSSPEKPQKA